MCFLTAGRDPASMENILSIMNRIASPVRVLPPEIVKVNEDYSNAYLYTESSQWHRVVLSCPGNL